MSRGDRWVRTACDYVHLNPVRAKLLRKADRLLAYPWSSFPLYLAVPEQRPRWLRTDRLLGEHGIAGDTAQGRELFEARMERRRLEEVDPAALKALRRGWCLGSQDFRKRLLKRREGRLGENHSAEARRETAEAKAERIIAAELTRRRWREAELKRRRKCDPQKVALGARLRRETTLTVKSIAARLNLGTPRNATTRLQEWTRKHAAAQGRASATGA